MSSFHTNTATRRGKKARTEGSRYANVLSTTGPTANESMAQVIGPSNMLRKPTLQHAVIGNHTSNGLTIQGGLAALDYTVGTNPDGREIPMGASGEPSTTSLADPRFPVRLAGPGHLYFPDPLEMPSIRGNLHVTGKITASGLDVPTISGGISGGVDGASVSRAAFAGVISDGTNAFNTTTVSGSIWTLGDLRYILGYIRWNGKGSASGHLRITGLPTPLTGSDYTLDIVTTDRDPVISQYIGGVPFVSMGSPTIGLMYDKESSSGLSSTVTEANFPTSGEIGVRGWIEVNP